MKHLIALSTLIAIVASNICDPSEITVKMYKDSECKVYDPEETAKYAEIPEEIYYLYSLTPNHLDHILFSQLLFHHLFS